jgi:hypothetical protein
MSLINFLLCPEELHYFSRAECLVVLGLVAQIIEMLLDPGFAFFTVDVDSCVLVAASTPSSTCRVTILAT